MEKEIISTDGDTATVEITRYVGVAWCDDCKIYVGPGDSGDVGYEVARGDHADCECENIDSRTVTERKEIPREEAELPDHRFRM